VEKRVRFKSAWLPWVLVAPQMAVVLVFFFWPAAQAVYQSVLTQDAFGTTTEFVGLENFRRLWNDDSYLASFKTTALFSILVAVLGLAIALLLAVMAAVWKQISYNFLFFLAGLQSIPRSLIEAASIDGASPWHRFWTIVFPLLSPTTFFLLVINVIYAFFETFAIVDSATQGGPGKDTSILVYKLYYDGFKALDMGGSAAQSVVLMFIVITLTVIQFRFVEKKVQY
jgi:ABC-type sugar transport system permease subunit